MSMTTAYYSAPIKTRLSDKEQVPKGWKWVDLRDVARLESGHTPSRRIPEYWEGGDVPWLSLKDVRGMTSRYVTDTIDKPTMLGIDNSSARILPKGTVAFCRTASVGNVAILGRDMATSQDFVDWVCGPKLLPEFLYEAFKASMPTFTNEMQGSTHKTIYMPTVERFKILLPPISEQNRIADILDKAEAVRRKRREALAEIEQLATSAYRHRFGNPIEANDSVPLGKCVTIISGGTPSKSNPDYWNGHFPWVSPKDMKVDYIVDAEDHVADLAFRDTTLKKLPAGAILIVVRGMILAHTVPVAITETPVAINQDMRALVPLKGYDPHFICWSLKSAHNFILGKVATAAHGTKRLEVEHIASFPIPRIPLSAQKEFAVAVQLIRAAHGRLGASEPDDLFNSLVQLAFQGRL